MVVAITLGAAVSATVGALSILPSDVITRDELGRVWEDLVARGLLRRPDRGAAGDRVVRPAAHAEARREAAEIALRCS